MSGPGGGRFVVMLVACNCKGPGAVYNWEKIVNENVEFSVNSFTMMRGFTFRLLLNTFGRTVNECTSFRLPNPCFLDKSVTVSIYASTISFVVSNLSSISLPI